MTGRVAVLSGLESNPYFVTYFPRQAMFGPDAPPKWAGKAVGEWVKSLPGRRWVAEDSCWHITATGIKETPRAVLEAAGFEVRVDPMTNEPLRFKAAGDPSLGFLVSPMAKVDDDDQATLLVRPRMSGFEATINLLGPTAMWKKDQGWFEASTVDIFPAGQANPRIIAVGKTLEIAATLSDRARNAIASPVGVDTKVVSLVAASDGVDVTVELDHLRGIVGDIPDWFGLDLFEYQKAGVLAAAAGHTFLGDDPGLGKGSPTWTKLLTPTGWTTYGEIEVGDSVVGSDGKPTTVIGVFPRGELDVFKVTMNDKTSVIVDGDHLWTVESTRGRAFDHHTRTLSTRELIAEGLDRTDSRPGNVGAAHFIPMVAPVQFAKQSTALPLDPYLLGVILGDGHIDKNGCVSFSSEDPPLADEFAARMPVGVEITKWAKAEGKCQVYCTKKAKGLRFNPLTVAIRELGLVDKHSDSKFVPEQYLLASVQERLDLLRGLMDTDGHAGVAAEFVTVSPHLRDGVKHLVESLGGQVRIATKSPQYRDRYNQLKTGRLAYRIIITMSSDMNPFLLERKATAWKQPFKYGPMRTIRSIEPAGRENVVCIAVDAEDQLYVTENFIVTHNTRQALGAVAMSSAKRTIVVCPPLVVTHWGREVTESGLAQAAMNLMSEGEEQDYAPPLNGTSAPSDSTSMTAETSEREENPLRSTIAANVAIFRAGRKEPELPDCGVVVVPDSLLAKRPELLAALQNWEPDALIYDEVHRAKTWTSARAKSGRALAEVVTGPRIAISGTPMFANPIELASPLAITGHLTPVFGGYTPFVTRYAKQNHFKAWVPRKEMLGELRERLNSSVWVRRHKKDVLKDLPPKLRSAEVVDVNLKEFNAAHKDVLAKVTEWLKEFKRNHEDNRWPTLKEMESFGAESIGLISPLRKAAGLAKVPLAAEWVTEWIASNTDTEIVKDGAGAEVAQKVYNRPLIVWAHHIEVVKALSDACGIDGVRVIDGSTSSMNRSDAVDDFQDGKVGVLIASITAAGVGITLTRGSDMLFVETDWTPATIIQAEDRCQRIGTTASHILCRTMIAEGTLDPHIQKVLKTKSKILDQVTGGDNNVSVYESGEDLSAPRQIIVEIAREALAKLDKNHIPV